MLIPYVLITNISAYEVTSQIWSPLSFIAFSIILCFQSLMCVLHLSRGTVYWLYWLTEPIPVSTVSTVFNNNFTSNWCPAGGSRAVFKKKKKKKHTLWSAQPVNPKQIFGFIFFKYIYLNIRNFDTLHYSIYATFCLVIYRVSV